ncbi:DNA gyrase inhibitor YacG [Pseudomonas amygdali pv. morsprunorum]|nr:DNA gyrase inhibitor YacG [Pseudomonas amygdali pv. morsprunorum]
MSQPMTVQCPTCDAPVEWSAASPSRPFCSARCKLIDLGAWASEEHAIPVSPDAEDELFSVIWRLRTGALIALNAQATLLLSNGCRSDRGGDPHYSQRLPHSRLTPSGCGQPLKGIFT